jgi:hypothetical protein
MFKISEYSKKPLEVDLRIFMSKKLKPTPKGFSQLDAYVKKALAQI